MPRNEFSQFLEKKFLEWQIKQGRRTTIKEFSKQIGVSRAAISLWLNGERTPDLINIQKLAEVFGFDVYDALGLPRPNPYLQKINQIFEHLSPEHQQRLAEDAEHYEVNKHEHISKTSKRRKNKQRDERRSGLTQERTELSRQIANITKAIADAGHSDALLDALKQKEIQRAQIKVELDELGIPIQAVPHRTQPEIDAASKAIIEALINAPVEQQRPLLRGIIHEVVAERDGKIIRGMITYYYPPPFDLAPTLPTESDPVGAHLYRQTFSYPFQSS